ncbi:MAG TPA: response regulator [Gemmatimonadales bacterium]|jgi:PleD family two-component response regulator
MPTVPAPLVLLANPEELFARSLETVLAPAGYVVLRAFTARSAAQQAERTAPDAVILAMDLVDPSGLDLCRALRARTTITASTPIFLTQTGPTSRQQRIEALRAGADELWGQPLDTEEFALRLAAELRAKLDADLARDNGLVDPRSTLWNDRGLHRRAEELLAQTARDRAPVAVAVVDTEAESQVGDWELGDRLADGLRRSARQSDAVGRLGPSRFAVVAPGTGPAAAARLGERLLGRLDLSLGAEGVPLRVGFASFEDASLAPASADMVERATSAVHRGEPWPQDNRIRRWIA